MIRKIDYHRFYVLDIETSTDSDDEGLPLYTFLSYGVISEYMVDGTTVRQTNVTRFRHWDELDQYLTVIDNSSDVQKIVFVHNLAYEFSFLQANLYTVKEVIAISSHKPIMCVFNELPNIQFRCTYQLSGMSLKKLGKLVGLDKLESEYRYIKPTDAVTDEEWIYCERDTQIPARYIEKLLQQYNLNTLPYTKTGFVRKYFKEEYRKTESQKCDWDRMPSESQIELMEKAFYGGITISNPMHTGKVLKNVRSYDETSAYPFVMLCEKFPRKFKHCGSEFLSSKEHFIATIRITNIHSKYSWGWISEHRLEQCGDAETFNGKVLNASYIVGTFTEIDLKSIELTYTFNNIEFINGFVCYDYKPIPQCYRKTILTYANEKTKLKKLGAGKGFDKDLDFAYMQAKSNLNSIYGMCVEKLIKPDWMVMENGEWEQIPGVYKYKDHVGRSYLFGVYVTAYARHNLLKSIVTNCPYSFVYADTDSIKYIDEGKPFIDTNKRMPSNSPPAIAKMGNFEYEGEYKEFLTYGAKKYAFTKEGDPNVYTVIAGLPKLNDYPLTSIEDVKPGLVFRNCKLAHKYIPECALYTVNYTLEITENDRDIINLFRELEGIMSNEKRTL